MGRICMKHFLFDIDGTLTPSRSVIDPGFKEFFYDFCVDHSVSLVTGSDYPKVLEQLGSGIEQLSVKIFCCNGNDVWFKGAHITENTVFTLDEEAYSWLQQVLEQSDFKHKTSKHFEFRQGMLNFSVLGRAANKEERIAYVTWDNNTNERHKIASKFNALFPKYSASLGGETGLDIYLKDKNKAQVLTWFSKEDKFIFFGDGIFPTGNDYPLAQAIQASKRGLVFSVASWKETYETLYYFK
jgi:phosphomannomutase